MGGGCSNSTKVLLINSLSNFYLILFTQRLADVSRVFSVESRDRATRPLIEVG